MKKLFTLCFAVLASIGTLRASVISVTDNSIADWNSLPAEYVVQAVCPQSATLTGLNYVKVYAEREYIYVLVEPNMSDLPDLEYVPFHIFIDTDNSDATGGYGDMFNDANTDILLEGALFLNNQPCSYAPAVFQWYGQVGGFGWYWGDQSVEHSADDCWGAIVCEGQLDCHSQYVNGVFEIQINRYSVPAVWNEDAFRIGFEIQQNWSAAGVLPQVATTDYFRANKLSVTIHSHYVDGWFVYGDEAKTILLSCSTAATGDIVLPNSVVTISDFAFRDCSGITSITIPVNVTSIGNAVFKGCSSLTSVVWNARNVTTDFYDEATPFYNEGYYIYQIIDDERYWRSNAEYAFDIRSQITSFIFGNEVETIPDYLCSGMRNLISIIVPENVTDIGNYVFIKCTNLTKLVVLNPNALINEYGQFYLTTSLKNATGPAGLFNLHNDYLNYPSYFPQKLDSIVVTGGELSENALWLINLSRKTLKSIDLSGTTQTDLPDEAFNEFYNLKSLKLPANLTHIGYKMVAECVKLKSIDIPASVTEIDDRAFEDCRSIETITFGGVQPSSVSGRKNALASSNIQLQRIGNWAFYNAHELQHLEIPEGVTEIGDGAFYGCVYLEDLVLPSSIQSIGDNCFALCAKLGRIVITSTTPPTIEAKTFYDVKRQIPVYVPDDCVTAYEEDEYWGEFDIQGVSEMPTGINTPSTIEGGSNKATKIIRDGQIFILRGEKTYTVTGAEVK